MGPQNALARLPVAWTQSCPCCRRASSRGEIDPVFLARVVTGEMQETCGSELVQPGCTVGNPKSEVIRPCPRRALQAQQRSFFSISFRASVRQYFRRQHYPLSPIEAVLAAAAGRAESPGGPACGWGDPRRRGNRAPSKQLVREIGGLLDKDS